MIRFRTACLLCIAAAVFAFPVAAQEDRGRTELTSPKGAIVIEYGRPQLKGRDPLTWQQEGQSWRMGSNNMTVLTTPVDLVFGAVKLPAGSYGLWLVKAGANRYDMTFNRNIEGHGMNHDKTKDVASVPLKKGTVPSVVETLTIDLKEAPGGGVFQLTWGTNSLSTGFQFGK